MSKHAVRRSFDRAAASYDAAAELQRMGRSMVNAPLRLISPPPW